MVGTPRSATTTAQAIIAASNAAAAEIAAALERNTAALLTVAAMIGKQTSEITADQLPDFIKDGVLKAFHGFLRRGGSQP